ncbi:MAG: SAM-dependent methyltransferase, partial [Veillonella sp.]|nr:SAM-dependent methyltransferase [Veillonella sp.]
MNDQERLDDLIIDGLQIYQRSDMFRFSFDAIALIHFCRFNGRHSY